jgi:DUF1680 family protein
MAIFFKFTFKYLIMKYNFLLLILVIFISCRKDDNSRQIGSSKGYPIQSVDIRKVKLTDDFWLPIIKRIQDKTIEYALEKCEEEGRMENFLLAGGVLEGETRGYMPFDDTDLYKIIEGASYSLISNPDPELDAYLDSLISIIETGQEEDGYLTTWRTINGQKPPATWVEPGERWEHLAASHELYNSGHMFEAAVAHYKATGKRNFLDIALKNADLLVNTFGPGKVELLPGHQIVETGLIKLFLVTGNEAYLDLSRYFLDQRGDSTTHELFGSYSQDHLPVIDQDEVVGHAVRAVYMYAGMTDIAVLQNDVDYRKATLRLWENMVHKKMYITGGIGASRHGEAFGENYVLPNLTAYSETCAAIGSVYWNHRLFMMTGDVQYYDVIERTLYNGLISGLSLDGQKFFYPNALESDGERTFNQGSCTRKSWFDCSCCPTNLIRFLPSVPGLIYTTHEDTLFVNLYASNEAEIKLNQKKVRVSQASGYPWNGEVRIAIDPEEQSKFTLRLRIPGWARDEATPGNLYQYISENNSKPSLRINGEIVNTDPEDRYFEITRKWSKGDELTLDLPMAVQLTKADDMVEDDRGKSSIEYGPIVFCVEEIDNPGTFDGINLSEQMQWEVRKRNDLLGGINVITGVNKRDNSAFVAIPYYSWSNRDVGAMKVWLPNKD